MRLHPAVTEQEALTWLRAEAAARWGEAQVPLLEEQLREVARSMATISAFPLPDTAQPYFP